MAGGSANPKRGKRFEREIVNLCLFFGFKSMRSFGSDGRSLGFNKEVDVVIGDYKKENEHLKVQAKMRKKLAIWLKPDLSKVDIQVVHEERGDTFVVIEIEKFLSILRKAYPKW